MSSISDSIPTSSMARERPRSRWTASKPIGLRRSTSTSDTLNNKRTAAPEGTEATSGRLRNRQASSKVLSKLDAKSAASARGLTDIAIRNLFILPTIAFLIIFNIFPLIYSLGFSFYDYSAAGNAPPVFVGLQNYKDLLASPYIWSNFSITAKYVLLSVGGQVIVGFGIAVLLNRAIPAKGLITTLLLLPMMMSAAVVGLFWQLLYSPSWGPINYIFGLGDFPWLSDPTAALYAVAITDIWMWSPFVMLLSLAGLSAVPKHL